MKYCNYEASFKTKDQEISVAPFDFELIEMYSSPWEDEHNPPFNFCRLLMEMIEHRFSDVLDEGNRKRLAASILNMNYFKFSDYIIKARSEQINKRQYAHHTKNLNWILNSEMEKDRQLAEKKSGKPISPLAFKEIFNANPKERRIKKALAKLTPERVKEIYSIVDEYLSFAVDCCSITPSEETKDLPMGASKLGGLADMPEDEKYPLDKNGIPMCLVCQLNLKEIAKILPGKMKKESGVLSFFLTTQEIFTGDTFRNYAVRYYDKVENLKKKPFFHPEEIAYHESAVKLNLRKSIPNSLYANVKLLEERIGSDRDLFEELVNYESNYIRSHFLGYEFSEQIHGIDLHDTDIIDEIDRLIPLLHLSGHEVKGAKRNIEFGDGDSIGFFIRPEDFEHSNFRNVAIALYS